MTYEVLFSATADRQLTKLPTPVQTRIVTVLKRCRIRPYAHVKRVVGAPYYRLRVGDYRVILDIIDTRLLIHVVEVVHRKKAYKRR
ncbi:MAG: type II toxin-antitoxin system RelE family toxin [Candidatus Woesearchaeota archaeon]